MFLSAEGDRRITDDPVARTRNEWSITFVRCYELNESRKRKAKEKREKLSCEKFHEKQCLSVPDAINNKIHGVHIDPCYKRFIILSKKEDQPITTTRSSKRTLTKQLELRLLGCSQNHTTSANTRCLRNLAGLSIKIGNYKPLRPSQILKTEKMVTNAIDIITSEYINPFGANINVNHLHLHLKFHT